MSDYMRASYGYHLARHIAEGGRNREATTSATSALQLLGEDPLPTTWNVGIAFVSVLARLNLCGANSTPIDEASDQAEVALAL